jgi:hypothetical protein
MRAQKFSADEFGLLVDAFDEMLSGIQSRVTELRKALLAREEALYDVQEAKDSLESSLNGVAVPGRLARFFEAAYRHRAVSKHLDGAASAHGSDLA